MTTIVWTWIVEWWLTVIAWEMRLDSSTTAVTQTVKCRNGKEAWDGETKNPTGQKALRISRDWSFHNVSQLTQSSLGISLLYQSLQAKSTPLLFLHFILTIQSAYAPRSLGFDSQWRACMSCRFDTRPQLVENVINIKHLVFIYCLLCPTYCYMVCLITAHSAYAHWICHHEI